MEIKSQAELPNKRLSIQAVTGVSGDEIRIWFWEQPNGLCRWNGLDLLTSGETVGGAFRRMAELVDSMPAKSEPITHEEFSKRKDAIWSKQAAMQQLLAEYQNLMVETLKSHGFDT